jgi:hypothetical protein
MRDRCGAWTTGEPNLRGALVSFDYEGRRRLGVVVTHIRNDCWQVASMSLPNKRPDGWGRLTLARDRFVVQRMSERQSAAQSP